MSDDLVQWLRAQLDVEEQIAREAMNAVSRAPLPGAGQWRYAESGADEGGRYWSITTVAPNDTVPTVELVGSGMSGGGVHEEALAWHIAEHDPARVLREIDAKRQILRQAFEHAAKIDGEWGCCHDAEAIEAGNCEEQRPNDLPLLRLLALPYADRPGYRDDWRP